MTTGGTCSEVVSRTMNYLQSDWAISQAATAMNQPGDASVLAMRASNFSLLFDSSLGFFRARDLVTGKFVGPFDQFSWGGDYTEAGPWQYKFYIPYNAPGLAAAYTAGGKDVCSDLQTAQTMLPTFHVGDYGNEIHEQTEMPEACWGQYEHGNQPVHHMLYMFAASDSKGLHGACAANGMKWLRHAQATLYKPGTDMFPGDEDNGQMSSWYLLSTLGLYSLAPGSKEMNLGVPLFGKVVVQTGRV